MTDNTRTPYEERLDEATRQTRVLQVRLNKVKKGSPEHEALRRNLTAASVLKAELEVLLEDAEERTLSNEV